jgi:hypothetical protein
MAYKDVKAAVESIDPKTLGKTKEDQTFRWHMVMLMFEIYGRLDSLSFSYKQMLEIQQGREQAQGRGKGGNGG